MKTLTLEGFKNEFAIQKGFPNWVSMWQAKGYDENDFDICSERYANYRAEQAAIAQRIICAEHAEVSCNCDGDEYCRGIVDKNSILNAPLASSIKHDVPKVLGDYDIWYEPCKNCGYDTGKSPLLNDPRCWKCGRPIKRDYSDRALKK